MAGGVVDVVEVLSGTALTGGQSMGACCGESSSFFVSSSFGSLGDGASASALVRWHLFLHFDRLCGSAIPIRRVVVHGMVGRRSEL